ncbi:hypothetical protein [Sorangium sp. So ce887]|uniref:hypothetical protein n=1 Tax=Sorangium sp. So ce887 TaxID=3133324 RepID=UPI003F614D14
MSSLRGGHRKAPTCKVSSPTSSAAATHLLQSACIRTPLTGEGANSLAPIHPLQRVDEVRDTVKRRTRSLYRQGLYGYDCIPTLREDWLRPLMIAFDRIVREHAVFRDIFGVI